MNTTYQKRLARAKKILAQIKALDAELTSLLAIEMKLRRSGSSAFAEEINDSLGDFKADVSAIFIILMAQRLKAYLPTTDTAGEAPPSRDDKSFHVETLI